MSVCSGQSIRIIETLPNDQFIIEIAGKEYRAINGDKAVELAKQKIDLNAALKIGEAKDAQIKELTLQRDLAEARKSLIQQRADSFEADFNRSQEDAKRNFNLFIGERELRTEAQQFIPHGKVSGFGGKVLSFLDGPYGQGLFKLAIPAATFTKTYFGRCSQ